MQTRTRTRRPNGGPQQPVRSVRVSDDLWNMFKARAEREGVTASSVLALFVEGYAREQIDKPQLHVVFRQPIQAVEPVPPPAVVADQQSA